MKLSVIISTYKKSNGDTKNHLTRCLESIKNQTYQNFHVYLIGDKYEDLDEFNSYKNILGDKCTLVNLPVAVERSKYPPGDILWTCGGVNAANIGIAIALGDGYSWIGKIDHDDWIGPNHFKNINDKISSLDESYVLVSSKATNPSHGILPRRDYQNDNFYPRSSDINDSGVFINRNLINLPYRNLYELTGKAYAADADLWNRLTPYMKENNLKGYLIEEVTCFSDMVGYSKKSK